MYLNYGFIHFIIPFAVFLCCLLMHNSAKRGYEKYHEKSFKEKYLNRYSHIFKYSSFNTSTKSFKKYSFPITTRPEVLTIPQWANEIKNGSNSEPIFASFFVLSSPTNFEYREQMRNELDIFLKNNHELNASGNSKMFSLTFVIGNSNNKTDEERINAEVDMFGDILWLPVNDTYRNLPLKSIGYFTFISNVTKQNHDIIKWIVKIDDDMHINYNEIFRRLKKEDIRQNDNSNIKTNSILCSTVQNNNIPVRRNDCMTRKW